MITNNPGVTIRTLAGAMVAAMLLAGCSKPAPEPEPAPPPAPATETTPAQSVSPEAAPTAPVQPAPDAPPPTEPSAAPKPTASIEPPLESMHVAAPSAKLSVAAELRYQFDSPALPNQPVTLHLAAVPRVAGSKLTVSVKQVAGIEIAGGALNLQKTQGEEVYRKQYSLTRTSGAPAELRVLVIVDTSAGSSFGFFSVPFDSGTSPQKQNSVKQR